MNAAALRDLVLPPRERSTMDYAPEDLHVHERQAVEALASRPGIFARGPSLVRLAGHDDEAPRALTRGAASEADAEALRAEPRVTDLTPATLRVALAERLVVREASRDAKGNVRWRPTRAPDDLVRAVLDRGAWPGVPELVGISEAPFLRPDGSVCTAPGLDAATGTLYAPSGAHVELPSMPTREHATRALGELEEVFSDFPHVSRAHRMVPIAALLTLLARPAIRGNVPAFLFDASTRGSGKSLQTDVVSIIARGRPSPKLSWPGDEAELSKVLAGVALRGAPMVNFDNVATGFGGASLDKVLTSGEEVEFRLLGSTRMLVLPWRTILVGSGNNLVLVSDTVRRVLVSRLESPLESPEDRTGFRFPHLLAHVASHRGRLLSAALTILRAYVVAGRPAQGLRPWGSFESFAALVPEALAWAGGPDADVMACRPEVSGAVDPEKAALLAVLEGWPRLFPEGGTAKQALHALYCDRVPGGYGPPDGFGELRDALESATNARPGMPPSAVAVGKLLQRFQARVADGRKLVRRLDRLGVAHWLVVREAGR